MIVIEYPSEIKLMNFRNALMIEKPKKSATLKKKRHAKQIKRKCKQRRIIIIVAVVSFDDVERGKKKN